jgi:D-lyxose ketol-isomerase
MKKMKEKVEISRRNLLGLTAGSLVAVLAAPVVLNAQTTRTRNTRGTRRRVLPAYPNSHYYNDGKFDESKARDAIIELARFHGYPITTGLREKLWVSDYGLGKFVEVGLAAVGIVNNLDGEYSYMLQDLFILPNQMLPEHWHVDVPAAEKKTRGAQKDEGWYVRWGRSYIIGEGDKNLPEQVKVPKSHGAVTVEHCTVADAGTFVKLTKRGSRHWQFAGTEGVILTEVANYHDNASVRHTNETANKHFLAGIK